MNRLERSWLFSFVEQYNLITLKIEQHENYRAELQDECERIDIELFDLNRQKERVLCRFAESFLFCSDKAQKKDELISKN